MYKRQHLIIHGTEDLPVPVAHAQDIAQWNSSAELQLIEGSGHTFGSKHPDDSEGLPGETAHVLQLTLDFFKS